MGSSASRPSGKPIKEGSSKLSALPTHIKGPINVESSSTSIEKGTENKEYSQSGENVEDNFEWLQEENNEKKKSIDEEVHSRTESVFRLLSNAVTNIHEITKSVNVEEKGRDLQENFTVISTIVSKFQEISLLKVDDVKEYQREAGQYLSMTKSISLICNFVTKEWQKCYKKQGGNREKPPSDVMLSALSALWNFSECSPEVTHDIVQDTDFTKTLNNILSQHSSERIEGKEMAEGDKNLVQSSLSIILNLSNVEENRNPLRGFVAIVSPYLYSKTLLDKFKALACLGNILDEKECEILQGKNALLETLLDKLTTALQDPNRCCQVDSESWSALKFTQTIHRLARNDANQSLLVEVKCLPPLVELVRNGTNEEQIVAMETIFFLACDRGNKKTIIEGTELNIVDLLIDTREGNKDKVIREKADKILWLLREELQKNGKYKHKVSFLSNQKRVTTDTKENNGQIMISYNWHHQKQLIKIRNELRSNGYSVWMDIDNIGGSTLESMAEAVEMASVVLICMSQKYKNSPNCRAEAEYAFQLRKNIIPLKMEAGYKPDGWLGFLTEAKLFWDFSGKYPFEVKFNELLTELAILLHHNNGSKTKDKQINRQSAPRTERSSVISQTDQTVRLGRKDLFDNFGTLDFYPMHKIQDIISMWRENAEVHLSFLGVEQLTDLVFQVFLLHYNQQRYSTVKKLELDGCIHLTDQALMWIASCFPELKSISLKGCQNVTETGLYQLLTKCKQLKEISLVGTGVSILPSMMTQLHSVDVIGCPLISPSRELYEKNGVKMMSVANYQKPKDKDVVKLCILQSSGATKSLLKFLTGKQDLKLDPVSVEFNLPLSPKVIAHMLEFSEIVADIFMTKRALFVLPVETTAEKVKEAANRLFGHINFVLSKDPKATIMIVGVNLGEDKVSLSGLLQKEVDILMQNEKDRLAREADSLRNPLKLSELNFEAQCMMAKACVLQNGIALLNILTADVNLSKPGQEDKSLLIEALLKGTKHVCDSYPEYQEISSPIFEYLQSNTVDKMYSNGASSLENSKMSTQYMLQLLQTMVGKIVIFQNINDAPMTFMTSWIGKILNVLFSTPGSGSTNQKCFYSVEDNVLVWQEEELAKALAADIGEAQIKIAIPILHKLGICLYSSQNVLIPYSFLPIQPQCPVEHYFPSTDPASSGNDIVMVTCTCSFSHAVPLLAIHRIINMLSKLRRPMLVWQEGAVFQEVVAEILILRQTIGAESSIVLCGQSIHSSRKKTELRDMVWMSIEQARIIVEFVLRKMELLYSMSCKYSEDKPVTLSPVIGGHNLQLLGEGQDNKKGKKCTTCGCSPDVITLLSAVFESTNPKFVKAEAVEMGTSLESVEVMGNLLIFTEPGKAEVHTFVSALEHNMCQFTVLQGDLDKINIMLRSFYNDFAINLGSKKLESVFKEMTSWGLSKKRQEIGSLPSTSIISIGDEITLRLDYSDETQEGKDLCWLTILVNAEIVKREKVPMVIYRPALEVTDEAIVLVSRLGTEQQKDTALDVFQHVRNNDYLPCSSVSNRTKVHEHKMVKEMESSTSEELYEFFGNYSKFFCILPNPFDAQQLRYPSLRCLSDLAHQAIHIICPGLNTEILHFVNSTGFPALEQSLENMLDYIQACCKGMLLQGEIMPSICDSLCSGLTGKTGELEEVWMKKIMFLYVAILDIIQDKTSSWMERISKQSGEVMELFNKVSQMPETRRHFTDLDSFIKCTGHKAASSVGQSLTSIPTEHFEQYYKFIDKLDFRDNIIEKLPLNFFQKFVCLEYLCLSSNQLVTILPETEMAHSLTYLDVSMNNIIDLPDLSKLEHLSHLNLSDNPLSRLPSFVFKLSKLKELNLANIGTIESLKGIGNLTVLTKLSLARNEIKDIPDEMSSLKVLSDLDISGVPWFLPLTATTSNLSRTAFNKTLNSNNVTRQINEETRQHLFDEADIDKSDQLTQNELELLNKQLFKKYSRFGEGNLVNSATGGFPPVLLHMKSLKSLNLSYHGLRYIPDDIKYLSDLHELNLSNNPYLETLSAELGGIPLKSLNLTECPTLKTPPKEIVSRGFVAVFGYLRRLRLGSVPCKRTKLMLVGLGGAGKTSLVRALTTPTDKVDLNKKEAITDGIDIKDWQVPLKNEPLPLTYSVWDFAGQTVYYNTHQFFLSNRAVYLLLWNLRLGYENAGLDFWLSSIACHAPKAPILVVGTHYDEVEKTNLPEKELKSRFPRIAGFHYVSSKTIELPGIKGLKEQLVEITLAQKYMGEQIPQAWLSLEKWLVGEHESKRISLLPFKTVESNASVYGISEKNELIQCIQFLHDLGSVQFFNTDFLRNQVVIYPQWIVDVMACIVTVHAVSIKDGKLLWKDMIAVWKEYDEELHPWLLRLTEEFDLTYPLKDEKASIVPCLLPDSKPQYEWPHADPAKNVKESKMVYHFKYLPAGLFNRAQVRLHHYSDGSLMWKKGSFLKKNNHQALIIQTGTSEVTVKAHGFLPGNILFLVHEVFEALISESYSGVKYDLSIPCLECQNKNDVKEPSMITSSKVHRALELNAQFLQCEKFFHILTISELQDSLPPERSDFDNHLRKSVMELKETNQENTHVFFLYTKKNVPDQAKKKDVVHPGTIMEDLRKEGFIVTACDEPESVVNQTLISSVKKVDVVLIGMSNEFCSTDNAQTLLLSIKDTLRKPVLLVQLGKWDKSKLKLSLGSEVYVSMEQIERYPHKIKELYEAILKKKKPHSVETVDIPKCFISYCWANSHDAIEKGTEKKDGSLGWEDGDPRKIKKFLTDKGISCWIDIENTGKRCLYEDIAKGLLEAKVMVACVSSEYVKSENCMMEFRFAVKTLRIPVILAIVGTGYLWEKSETGMLAINGDYPRVNFQLQNDTSHLDLLNLVQKRLPSENNSNSKGNQSVNTQRQNAFQEVLELAQRKFLRHVSGYTKEFDTKPYPQLICVDLVTEEEKTRRIVEKNINADGTDSKKETSTNEGNLNKTAHAEGNKEEEKKDEIQAKEDSQQDVSGDVEIIHKSKYCFRLLCEHEQGWHVVAPGIPFPELTASEEQDFLSSLAPYLMRIMAILKHCHVQLNCLTILDEKKFLQKLEEMDAKKEDDIKEAYFKIRKSVMEKDKEMVMGNLKRVQLPNGKTYWLCDEHKSSAISKTEILYKDKLTIKESYIPIPTDVAEAPFPSSQPLVEEKEETVDKPNPAPSRRIFKQRGSQIQDRPRLQRQSSQACSVM